MQEVSKSASAQTLFDMILKCGFALSLRKCYLLQLVEFGTLYDGL